MGAASSSMQINGSGRAGLGGRRLSPPSSPPGASLDLSSLLPSAWLGGVYASGAPELRKLTFGILPLTDCAPIVVAHERCLFAKHGIESAISKFTSWTSCRDALMTGEAQAAHMLFGMPVAAAVGRLGTEQKPLIIPWILSRNGQAITLSMKHSGTIGATPKELRPRAIECRDKGRPLVFGMTLGPGTHAMWLRYWLAAGGIDPDRDVALITIPPPQMVANMRSQRMDGFCVGEPWNARAVAVELGYTAILSEQIWPDHPEKVLAFAEEFAETNPNSVKAALRAIYEASLWCDDPANRAELVTLLSDSAYVGVAPQLVAERLGGTVDCGNGRTVAELRGPTFAARNANYPQAKYAVWWLAQFRRWRMLTEIPEYLGVAGRVMRPDFYDAALKELGVTPGGADFAPDTLFDGNTFEPSEPEEYAASFQITALRKN
ncbi:MAG: CmpA/NrtA family ABC transporter substrate-binding protein [Chthoniobacter sp.]|uniref:CmpA/NrtA family ABC transporter substrate-binding protein n=1 Tax=Chthoniobacter sp. TaxID=2510640 RepID=UPI0032A2C4A7